MRRFINFGEFESKKLEYDCGKRGILFGWKIFIWKKWLNSKVGFVEGVERRKRRVAVSLIMNR